MLRNLSEKLKANFLATTCGYSMANMPVSMMLSWMFLNGKQAQKNVNHCSKKVTKGEKKRPKRNEKPKDVGHFLV